MSLGILRHFSLLGYRVRLSVIKGQIGAILGQIQGIVKVSVLVNGCGQVIVSMG